MYIYPIFGITYLFEDALKTGLRAGFARDLLYGLRVVECINFLQLAECEWVLLGELVLQHCLNLLPVAGFQGRITQVGDGWQLKQHSVLNTLKSKAIFLNINYEIMFDYL